MDDTAELDLPVFTADDEEEAPPLEETETDELVTTDQEDEDETTETDPLAEVPEDRLLSDPRVTAKIEAEKKSIQARLNESYRQKAEAAERDRASAQYSEELKAFQTDASVKVSATAMQNAVRAIVPAVREALGDDSWAPTPEVMRAVHGAIHGSMQPVVNGLLSQVAATTEEMLAEYRKEMFPKWNPPENYVQATIDARNKKDYKALAAASIATLLQGVREVEIPSLIAEARDDERKKVLAEVQANRKVTTDTKAVAANAKRPQATAVNGATALPVRWTLDVIDSNWAKFQREIPDAKERARIIAKAHEIEDKKAGVR